MKLAISTDNDMVSAHFGRCQCYIIVDIDGHEIKSKSRIDTPPHQPGFLPGFLNQQGVNCVITGGMGPRAQNLFRELNIEPIIGVSGMVDEVIDRYISGQLEAGESQCTHGEDHHHQCGD